MNGGKKNVKIKKKMKIKIKKRKMSDDGSETVDGGGGRNIVDTK